MEDGILVIDAPVEGTIIGAIRRDFEKVLFAWDELDQTDDLVDDEDISTEVLTHYSTLTLLSSILILSGGCRIFGPTYPSLPLKEQFSII